MKFTCSVSIEAPLERVVSLFSDRSNNKYWQEGLEVQELLSGEEGETGAITHIVLKNGKQEIVLKETILESNLPEAFIGLYEHKHMTNTMSSTFNSAGTHTEYSCLIEYTKFVGILPKLMASLFPSMFKKQTQKWLKNFKEFVEKQ